MTLAKSTFLCDCDLFEAPFGNDSGFAILIKKNRFLGKYHLGLIQRSSHLYLCVTDITMLTDPSGQLNVSVDTQMIFPQHLISVPVPGLLGSRRAGVRDSLESIAKC